MIAIVESRADRASSHICEHLLALADWEERIDDSRADGDGGGRWYRTSGFELRRFDERHLDLERPVEAFDGDPEFLVFASRHAGDTGPLLTGHFTGNVGPAEFGGEDHALAEAAPNALAALLEAFERYAPDGYEVGLECTHHGPTDVGCPSLFAELGSADEQWDDPAGAEAVARAILALEGVAADGDRLESHGEPTPRRHVVGLGGPHYAPRFERIGRETPWAVGHVASDWGLEALAASDAGSETRRRVIGRAFEASAATVAVVDGDHPDLAALVTDLGHRVVSETWLREVGDRPLTAVERVETQLGAVDDGVRFGEHRGAFSVVDLPTDLVAAAEGVDPDAVRAALERRTVAFETSNGASRSGARAAFPDGEGAYLGLVGDLAGILEASYDEVRIEVEEADDGPAQAGQVVARTQAFDPERARALGVEAGPDFGALTRGESVTVDGERVQPADVHVERVRQFSLTGDSSEE
ncbi:D-aminoacyl-tRNA deacylase [Natronobiforma cellulositropha]|uniref:D-aminoacyl-tRNA deacylase n=1 Tax=Natronobiforma cellulositropha TaxID=1679076 RepID=UPI0021D5FA2F|nr:D-aminoacyl-tRNA deacylase [Natronobiforma cellulositropha]